MKSLFLSTIVLGFSSFANASNTEVDSSSASSWAFNQAREMTSEEKQGSKAFEKIVFSSNVAFEKRWESVSKAAQYMRSYKQREDFLIKCLKQKEWFLKSPALKVLQKENASLALEWARKLFKGDKALVVRSDALVVINNLRDESASELLWKELYAVKNFNGSSSLWIRPQIVKTLRKIEKTSKRKTWESLLNDSDVKVQAEARKHIKVTRF